MLLSSMAYMYVGLAKLYVQEVAIKPFMEI